MVKKTLFFFLIVIILFAAGMGVYLTTKAPASKKPIMENPLSAAPTPVTESELAFAPDTLIAVSGVENRAAIQIKSQGEQPNFIQLEMAYDPEIISDVKLVPGNLFEKPEVQLNNIDISTGRISYAISQQDRATPSKNFETAAILSFKINKNTGQQDSSIYFLPKTVVKGRDANIALKVAYGLKVVINPKTSQSATNSAIKTPVQ